MHAVLEASAILHERVVHLVSLVDPCDRRQGTVHDRFHSKRLSSFESNSSGHAYRAPEKETEMEHGHQRETQRQTVKRPGIGGCQLRKSRKHG
jgi:hypothetical protein